MIKISPGWQYWRAISDVNCGVHRIWWKCGGQKTEKRGGIQGIRDMRGTRELHCTAVGKLVGRVKSTKQRWKGEKVHRALYFNTSICLWQYRVLPSKLTVTMINDQCPAIATNRWKCSYVGRIIKAMVMSNMWRQQTNQSEQSCISKFCIFNFQIKSNGYKLMKSYS